MSRVVTNAIELATDADVVFDYMTDLRNEPRWNPQMRRVEKMTDGAVGRGTRFRIVFGRGVGEALVEHTGFDRPRSWSSLSRSRLLDVESANRVEALPGGCRLVIGTQLLPHGALRLVTPLLRRWMRATWARDLETVKTQVEQTSQEVMNARARITRVPVPDLCCLWAETPTAPMHMALIGVLDQEQLTGDANGSPDDVLLRVRQAVQVNLHRVPLLRQVLHATRLGEGGTVWVDDPGFEIDQHLVLACPPPPLTDASFLTWCAQRSVLPLDRARPLWRMDVVPGLPGGRVGVLVVLHHVVADGLRGVELVSSLLDPVPRALPDDAPEWHPQLPPSRADLVQDNVRRRAAAAGHLRPSRLFRSLRGVRELVREPGGSAPATFLAGSIRPGRQVAVETFPLEELRYTAHAQGCSINELLLAAVTTGLRNVLLERGECRPGLVLRASVPVGALAGRGGGMMMAPLPVGIENPATRLRLIVEATRPRKERADQGVAGIVSMPAGLARLGVRWARRVASSHINLYVTNVPGPPHALYLAGARLLEAVPLAPLVAGVRLSVAALSYDGQFVVTLHADDGLNGLPVLAESVRSALSPLPTAATTSTTG